LPHGHLSGNETGASNLDKLGQSFTQVTPEGVNKLQEALQKCKIIR
jgi:hypothetical protein